MAEEYPAVVDDTEERRRREEDYAPVPVPSTSVIPAYAKEPTISPDLAVASPHDLAPLKAIAPTPITPVPVQTPAQTRLRSLTEQGAPPVQPLHGFKRGLDILGQIAAPKLEQRLRYRPQAEYERNLKQAESDVAAEQAPEAGQAKIGLEEAQAEEAKARAKSLENPPEKVGQTPEELTLHYLLTGDNGKPVTNPKTGKPYNTVEAFRALKEIGAETKPPGQEQNKLDFQGIVSKVDAGGLPTGPKEIDKSLDAALKRGLITREEHSKARSYQAANPTPGTNLTVTVAGAQQKQDFQHTEKAEAETYKRYETAQDAEQRLSRMEASYQKGLKGDQQAMLALLTDHIGMTLGLQKGARITKDILHEATASMPWLEKIESKFDSRGYLSGVTLGPEQMAQMLDLGYEARDRAVQGAQDSSKLYGVAEPPGATEVFGKRKIGEKPALQHGTGEEPPRPDHVPKDYVYHANGPKGAGWYKP